MMVRTWLEWLATATLWMSAGAVMTLLVLRVTRCRHWRVHRWAWGAVLLQGVLCGWIAWKVPIAHPTLPAETGFESFDVVAALSARADTSRPSELATTTHAATRSATPRSSPDASLAWTALGLGWLVGFLGTLGSATWRYIRWYRRIREAEAAPAAWQGEWDSVLQSRGYGHRIPLRTHADEGPLLAWLPGGRALIVPAAYWATRSRLERRAVLEHEAGHVVRRDLLISLVARLIASIHWFNPLARLARRRFDESAEWACDAALAERHPSLATVLGRALLELAAAPTGRVATVAAGGARLSHRLRRLLIPGDGLDAPWKRWIVISLAALLVLATAVRIRLVAQPPRPEDSERRATALWHKRLEDLAKHLDEQDKVSKQVRDKLASPAAVIVIRDRIAGLAEERRQELRRQALPDFFTRHFVEQQGKLAWCEDQENYKAKFLRAAWVFNQDLGRIEAELRELAEEVGNQTPADQLMRRFLTYEGAPVVLYVREIQHRLRPSVDLVARQLGELFVADEQYHYRIRESRREEAEHFVDRALEFAGAQSGVAEELQEYERELSESSSLEKKLKSAMSEPDFAAFIMMWMFRETEGDAEQATTQFFEQLNELLADTASGLAVVHPEARQHLTEILKQYDRIRKGAPAVTRAAADFSEKIEEKGELERKWKRFLKTRMAVVLLSAESDQAADAGAAARALVMHILSPGEDGKLHLTAPEGESEEELIGYLREMFRAYRMLRLQVRPIERYARRMSDQPTKTAMSSLGGKVLVLQEIDRSLQQASLDVWNEWLDHMVDRSTQPWRVRAEVRPEWRQILRDIEAIEAESQKDDF